MYARTSGLHHRGNSEHGGTSMTGRQTGYRPPKASRMAGVIIARIQSHSMTPTLLKGDTVLLKKECSEALRKGDLIGFTSDRGIPLIHRIFKLTGDAVRTVADANDRADPPVLWDNIIGKVMAVKINSRWRRFDRGTWSGWLNAWLAFSSRLVIHFPRQPVFRFVRLFLAQSARRLLESDRP